MVVMATDPASGVAYTFDDTMKLHNAIVSQGFAPIRADGTQMIVTEFEGGILIDGAPINVWMGEGWFVGQRELLIPFWSSGEILTPPDEILNLGTVAMPPDVAAGYKGVLEDAGRYVPDWVIEQAAAPSDTLLGLPSMYVYAGAAVLGLALIYKLR